MASGEASSVSGGGGFAGPGAGNRALGDYSHILGGEGNTTSGNWTVILGGAGFEAISRSCVYLVEGPWGC